MYEGKKCKFEILDVQDNPGEILWQNMGVSKIEIAIRLLLYVLLIVGVMTCCFLAILYGQTSLNSLNVPADCSTVFAYAFKVNNNSAKKIDFKVLNFDLFNQFMDKMCSTVACIKNIKYYK